MKKQSLFFTVALAMVLLFTSCTSTSEFSINRLRHHEPSFADIPYDAYTVLQRVSGSATVSLLKGGAFEGDSGKYGSLDTSDAVYLNISQKTVIQPTSAFDAALGNALYKMNEEADKLKADAILFVRTKTEVKNTATGHTVTVTVTGAAVKLK